jgi:hypothetical protein
MATEVSGASSECGCISASDVSHHSDVSEIEVPITPVPSERTSPSQMSERTSSSSGSSSPSSIPSTPSSSLDVFSSLAQPASTVSISEPQPKAISRSTPSSPIRSLLPDTVKSTSVSTPSPKRTLTSSAESVVLQSSSSSVPSDSFAVGGLDFKHSKPKEILLSLSRVSSSTALTSASERPERALDPVEFPVMKHMMEASSPDPVGNVSTSDSLAV